MKLAKEKYDSGSTLLPMVRESECEWRSNVSFAFVRKVGGEFPTERGKGLLVSLLDETWPKKGA